MRITAPSFGLLENSGRGSRVMYKYEIDFYAVRAKVTFMFSCTAEVRKIQTGQRDQRLIQS